MARKRSAGSSPSKHVTKRKSPRKKKAGGASPRRASLRSMSVSELRAELERRTSELRARRAQLVREIEEIDREIEGVHEGPPPGAAPHPPRRGRGGNTDSLETHLARALRGKTMGVAEVADAVQRAGYKTASPNFRTIVNQCLLKSELIRKVGHGKYTAA